MWRARVQKKREHPTPWQGTNFQVPFWTSSTDSPTLGYTKEEQIAQWRNRKCKQLRRQASVQIGSNCELLFPWKLGQIAHWRNGKCKQLRRQASVQIVGNCELLFSWKLEQIAHRRNGKCKQLRRQASVQIGGDCEFFFSWKLRQIVRRRNGKCKQLTQQVSLQIISDCELLFSSFQIEVACLRACLMSLGSPFRLKSLAFGLAWCLWGRSWLGSDRLYCAVSSPLERARGEDSKQFWLLESKSWCVVFQKTGNLTSHRVLRLGVSTNQANSVEPTPADPLLWLNGRGENIKVGKVFFSFSRNGEWGEHPCRWLVLKHLCNTKFTRRCGRFGVFFLYGINKIASSLHQGVA